MYESACALLHVLPNMTVKLLLSQQLANLANYGLGTTSIRSLGALRANNPEG